VIPAIYTYVSKEGVGASNVDAALGEKAETVAVPMEAGR
jgi:hypothetical protein